MFADRIRGVDRTRGHEPTRSTQERAQRELVEPQQGQGDLLGRSETRIHVGCHLFDCQKTTENRLEILFQAGRVGVKERCLWNHNQIHGNHRLVESSERLSNQSLSSISHHRPAKLLRGDDAEAGARGAVSSRNDGEVSSMGSAAGIKDALEFCPSAQAPTGWQSVGRHAG
jgi:hypothetical protein